MRQAQSPAKINLFLNIVGKRDDGYHLLESLFVPLPGLYDQISVEPAHDLTCEMTPEIPDNIVLKVARRLQDKYGVKAGAKIKIKKKIPIAAGLGGGSSNAATVLKLLCELWNVKLEGQEAIDFLVQIGADVPYFLNPQPAFVQGIGEIITPVQLDQKLYILLANPKIKVDTGTVCRKGFPEFAAKIDGEDVDVLGDNIFLGKNDLEANAISLFPEIQKVLVKLRLLKGCKVARMSGSGATCFGLFKNAECAQKAMDALPRGWWCHYEMLEI